VKNPTSQVNSNPGFSPKGPKWKRRIKGKENLSNINLNQSGAYIV
jgi:hypothetical protein